MKILTNIRFHHLAGISQTTQSFLSFFREQHKDTIVGVNLTASSEMNYASLKKNHGNCYIISEQMPFPDIKSVVKTSRTVEDLRRHFKPIIDTYRTIIESEKPDVILINGTYFLPWCLYQASLDFTIHKVLHYHGILTKEISYWEEENRFIFEQMEKTFADKSLFYIFPSMLAKETVEREVFAHKITNNFSVIPNPVFFKPILRDITMSSGIDNKKNIGLVARWTQIKNPFFFRKIARFDLKQGDKFDFHVVTDLPPNSPVKKRLSGLLNFQPSMNHLSLKKYYDKMDVMLSPSHFETYGNVAQEALVHGTPALISPHMGVAETYKRFGLDQWIIDFGSASNVYKKIHDLSDKKVSYQLRRAISTELAPHKIHGETLSTIKRFVS